MNTIHDGVAGSEAARLRAALIRTKRSFVRLGRTKDALEAVLGAGSIGFCRIRAGSRRLAANPHFKAHFGWPPDATLERVDLGKRVHPHDRAALSAALTAAFEQSAPVDLTVRALWPGGKVQFIALRGTSECDDKPDAAAARRARAIVLVATNVTAEHQALSEFEAALAQETELRTRAEAANHSNLELLSLVSHELRSPLNAVLGWNRILAIKRADDPEVVINTTRIERSAKAQLRIVNDLLDFGRMGTGRFKLAKRAMKLAAVAANAFEASGPAACAKGIELSADFAATLGELDGDAERLGQVITQLLSNAIKFTPRGGSAHASLRRDASNLVFEITDTGQGIAPEKLARLFERIRTEDSSGAQGLGLGLALVREIVMLHGGTLHVASEGAGRGTQVTVRLPAGAAASTQPAVLPEATRASIIKQGSLSGLAILVVDDEADARTVVAELLRLEGAEVAVCDSAASAYEKLSAIGARFDVVVTDIGMPVEDGYSLVRRMRALKSAGSRVLAIALTGFTTTSDAVAALDAGFDMHVAKPVDFASFVPMIRQHSRQPQHLRPVLPIRGKKKRAGVTQPA